VQGRVVDERPSGEIEASRSRLATLFNRRRLSPTQRRLARYIMDHPREAPFLSSVELASRVGVSQPSVTRFAVALGYDGYAGFQKGLRRLVLTEAQDVEAGNKFESAVAAEVGNLKVLRDFLGDASVVSGVGRCLAASEPLVVLGLHVSVPLAIYFGYFAEKIHPDVRTLTEGGSVAADRLSHARQAGGEWVLCFLLPRYPRETVEALSYARVLGFRIATVTDRAPESVARLSDLLLPAEVGTELVFDSQAAAMVLAGALLEALSDASPKRTQARLEEFEQRAAKLGWFVGE
jgi:DNA-binding MurR/RpiR family transcriptional regulator